MANADAFNAGFGIGKKDAAKGKKDGEGSGLFAKPKSFKKGGKVKKTGIARVHKGEVVLTAAEAKKCSGKKKGTHKKVSSKR